jgi:uncharacterized protein (DUF58 family)
MMSIEGRPKPGESRGVFGRLAGSALRVLWPTQRVLWTKEGLGYVGVWLVLLALGLQQQINLILLVAGLAAGPVAASFLVSLAMLRKLRVTRRVPPYAFSGDPLHFDYTLENARRWAAALALFIEDDVVPADRTVSGATSLTPKVFYARVPGRERARERWNGVSPKRGRYKFRTLEIVTRSPFGLLERRVTVTEPDELIVYPTVGQLTRRWNLVQRQASETRRGHRHDRSTQQQEYHGLRDYRPGDSPRWIHWRTSARLGQPMVKEFEQQNEQDLAILLDPWLPRTKVTPEQREVLEQAVQFAATVCLETCRRQGRRILLGWTGATPGLQHGPVSVKMLHELLGQLAVLRASSEGSLAALLDILPPATLREAILIVVSTRPVNLIEEAEKSVRLSGTSSRGLLGRVVVLDASHGDLSDLVQYDVSSTATAEVRREPVSVSGERMSVSGSSREMFRQPGAPAAWADQAPASTSSTETNGREGGQ